MFFFQSRFIAKIVGNEDKYSLSHRILNATAFLGIILMLIAIISNYLLDLSGHIVLISGFSLLYFGYIYYMSLRKGNFRLTYNLVGVYVTFFFIPAFWIINGGSIGGFQYFVFFFLFVIISTGRNWEKWLYCGFILVSIVFLIFFEFEYPDLVIGYSGEKERRADVIISFLLAMVSVVLGLEIFIRSYIKTHDKLVSQNAQIEEQRKKLNLSYTQLQEISRSRDTVFSIISHDLKGPAGSLHSYLTLLQKDPSLINSSGYNEVFGLLVKQSNSVYNTLSNLLLWANNGQSAGSMKIALQSFTAVLTESVELLEENARQKNITIINEIDEELMAVFDAGMVSTVFRNLISNAIKFTSKNGKITISAIDMDGSVVVSVEDNGTGICEEKRLRILDSSYFESTPGTEFEEGSGLGLKICTDFIEKLNGKIWVESEPNQGSIFRFSLPGKENWEDKY